MKLFILSLIIATLLQTTLTQYNLVLILLITRSFIVSERANLYIAFCAGVLLGLMTSVNLGLWTTLFVVTVWLVHLIKKMPIAFNFKTFLPTIFILLLAVSLFEKLVFNQSFVILKILTELLIAFPMYIVFNIWSERFDVKPYIRLKL